MGDNIKRSDKQISLFLFKTSDSSKSFYIYKPFYQNYNYNLYDLYKFIYLRQNLKSILSAKLTYTLYNNNIYKPTIIYNNMKKQKVYFKGKMLKCIKPLHLKKVFSKCLQIVFKAIVDFSIKPRKHNQPKHLNTSNTLN